MCSVVILYGNNAVMVSLLQEGREREGGAAQKLNPNYQQAKVLKAKTDARKKERFFLIFASAAAAVSDIKYLQSHHNYSFLPFLSFLFFS